MFRSLIWKEWQEQRWKLGFGCIILTALAAIGLRTRIVLDEDFMMSVIWLGICLLPVLAAMGMVAPERADGSIHSLLALPTSTRRILAAKTLLGLALCAAPLITAAIASCLIAGGREVSVWRIIDLHARGVAVALALFIWMLACSIHLGSEARAGLIGLGLLVFWLLASMGLFIGPYSSPGRFPPWSGRLHWISPLNPLAQAICPFAFLDSFPHSPPLALAAAMQIPIGIALWFWAVSRLHSSERSSA